MAFTSGKIKSDEDRKHVATKGFKDIFGQPFPNPYAWAIDREKDIILISRGEEAWKFQQDMLFI